MYLEATESLLQIVVNMINTLPYLSHMPAHLIMGGTILLFFLAKAIPKLREVSPSVLFIIALAAAFLAEYWGEGSQSVFYNMLYLDSYSRLYNQIFFIATVVIVLMVKNSDEIDTAVEWEMYGLMATSILGMMMMTSSMHLLMIVIGIELVSIPSYLLVAMNRKVGAAKEASLKYVLFGSLTTGIMLYGMSLIFGLTGTLQLEAMWQGLSPEAVLTSPIFLLALTMTLAGMAFKIAAVPFHFWCPDAYQAAPTPITAFLSVAPKVAGVGLIMRFFAKHLDVQGDQLTLILSVLAMITMTVGNVAALRQTDIKRLLAYSSIGHAGFLLMGISVLNDEGMQFVFYYILVYMIMNLAAFMAVIYMSRSENFEISSFAGMITKRPLLVVGFTVCLFSLAGIPPFAGFIGKFYLFKVVVQKGLYLLAAVAAVNSVVSLYYYVNVIKVMIIDKPEKDIPDFQQSSFPVVFVAACTVPLVVFGLYWVPLLRWSELAVMFR